MDLLKTKLLIPCADGIGSCISPRNTVTGIALLSLAVCFVDHLTPEAKCTNDQNVVYGFKEHVNSMRDLLLKLFQMANLLLLLASMVENATLLQIYVWYALSYVSLGLVVSLLQFLSAAGEGRVARGLWVLVSEVAFHFVIFHCLPFVDAYRKILEH